MCTPETAKHFTKYMKHSNKTSGRFLLSALLLAVCFVEYSLLFFVSRITWWSSFCWWIPQQDTLEENGISRKREWAECDWAKISIYDPNTDSSEKEGFWSPSLSLARKHPFFLTPAHTEAEKMGAVWADLKSHVLSVTIARLIQCGLSVSLPRLSATLGSIDLNSASVEVRRL